MTDTPESKSERDTSLRRMRELFDGWKAKHNEGDRARALGDMKGRLAGLRSTHDRTIEWAKKTLPGVLKAREELGVAIGPVVLARWLNANSYQTIRKKDFYGSNLGTTLFNIADVIADEAVLECRTKMSALALSANFELRRSEVHALEAICIERIKEGIKLARELEHLANIEDVDRQALRMAVDAARRQRTTYAPMLARECYLIPDPREADSRRGFPNRV